MSFWIMLTLRSWRISNQRSVCRFLEGEGEGGGAGHTGDGFLRDEHAPELVSEITAVLVLAIHGDTNRQATRLHDIAHRPLEAVDPLVADGETADFDLATHAIHADDKGHG